MDRKAFGIPLSDIITQVIYQVYGLHGLTLAERVELNNFIDDSLFQLTRRAQTCELSKLQPEILTLVERLRKQQENERSGNADLPGLFRFTGMSDEYQQKAILSIQCITELVEEQLKNDRTSAPH